MSAAVSTPKSAQKDTLRPPFQKVVGLAEKVSSFVNSGVDGTVNTVSKNSWVVYGKNTYKRLETNLQGKVRPITDKTEPYVRPVVPYIKQATPYIPPVAIAVLALASIPVFFTGLIVALFTAPIWLTIAFFTAFIWIPIAISAFTAVAFFGFVASVRFLSKPTGQKILKGFWETIISLPGSKRIFYSPVPQVASK